MHLRDLSRALAARGHEVCIITATPGVASDGDVRIERLPVPLLPRWRTIGGPRALAPLARVLADGRFDVVHGHSVYSPLAQAAMFLARRLGVPSLLTNHSLLAPHERLLLGGLDGLFDWGAQPDLITAVSAAAARATAAAAGRDDVLVVPNGLDLAAWRGAAPAPPAADTSTATVVSVMRLCARKRPIDLVRAAARTAALLPAEEQPRFVIIGDGPERLACEREAARLGVRGRIDFLGVQPRAGVRAHLARAAMFALPTVREAFSIAILEARAAGLPVVAMRRGGVGELVSDGRNGLLADTPDELGAQIARLCRDRALRARLAAAAPRDLEPYDHARVLARFVELYAQARVERERRNAGFDHRRRGGGLPAAPDGLPRDRAGDGAPALAVVHGGGAGHVLHHRRHRAALSRGGEAARRSGARAGLPR
jgi:glycosyltransferase involved in cell wall biosynthesis